MKIKFVFFLSVQFLFILSLKSQDTINFGYDDSGNRTSITDGDGLLKFTKEDNQEKQEQNFLDKLGENDILIYPNPVNNELKIEIPNLDPAQGFASLVIFNQEGRLVYKIQNVTSSNILYLQDLPAGIYYLNIRIGEEKVNWKIIKE